MALFDKKTFSYDILREGEEIILKIDCENYTKTPSLEEDPVVMSKVIEFVAEAGNITKIILSQKRNYEYEYSQTILLVEVARVYKQIIRNRDIYSYNALVYDQKCTKCIAGWYAELRHIISDVLRSDPIGAYVELRRIERREKLKAERAADLRCKKCENNYIRILNQMMGMLDKTRLMALVRDDIAGYKLGDRSIYKRIFSPVIKPDFLFTKLMASYPVDGEELDSYSVEGSEITIFAVPDTILYLYHITPPEFRLSEDRYEILDAARKIMSEHKPKRSEFTDPARMRDVFFNVGRDLIEELIGHRKIRVSEKDVDQLTSILVRYTVGFGLIEVLLQDEKIQDISVNPPMGQVPIFIVQQDFGDCKTNVIPTAPEAESWASKLRMISGRPLDEANPVLDTEITIPGAAARVSTLTQPLSPNGLAYSFRRHRDRPWTLPLFMKNRMVSALGAGLLSFLIDGTRTFFICGTRGSGKTSFLSSCMIELMRRSRIITIEDTLELPFESFKALGYNFVQMKVASALAKESSEYTATDGIRSTLRLGDSAIFVGEVRSKEAIALFEAMRIGAGSNMVGGTFHADSPYGVFDRCVNAIGIPRTSFKALDCCVIANPIRSADGMHMWRRILQITEVRKTWKEDPLTEGGFVDLMKYQADTDQLEPTNDLINGESEIIKSIAGNVKEWAGNWDAVWENITLRSDCKTAIVELADKAKNPELLEAEFVIQCNDEFHRIINRVKEKYGETDPKRVLFEYKDWLKKAAKKKTSLK